MSTAGYLSLTDADREAMLEAIGVGSLEELFEQIPQASGSGGELDVPEALPEATLVRHLEELAARNADTSRELSFLGMGIYDHYVPAIVDTFLSRGELLTAYTPYQPEMSQGMLQAIFEYQTAICELTGMDVSNASGYDGTTVAADACFIAPSPHRSLEGRPRGDAEPAGAPGREDLRARDSGWRSSRFRTPTATTDPARLAAASADAAAVIFQQPNAFGCLEPRPRARRRGGGGRGAAGRARRPRLARPARGAGRLRVRDGDRRGPVDRELPELRRPALRVSRRAQRVHPPDAGPDRRRDDRPRGQARVRAHAADARAAHPAREGDVEHHDEPDAARARRPDHPVLARPRRPPRARRDLHRARRVREGAGRPARSRSTGRRSRRSPSARRSRPARSSPAHASTASTPATRSAATTRASTTSCSSRSPRSARPPTSTASPTCSRR